jgi:hypothetical protein
MPTSPSSTTASTKNVRVILTAVLLALSMLMSFSSPASASPAAITAPAAVHQVTPTTQVNVSTITPGAGLCVGAINGSRASALVAAFALGYCPTWTMLQTSWGRSAVNWALNSYCKVPWLVRLATNGQYSRC